MRVVGRLKLTLYLGGFVLTFVAAGLVLAIVAARPAEMPRPPSPSRFARDGIDITFYDGEHRVAASNVQPPIPREAAPEPWTTRHLVQDTHGNTLEVLVRPRAPERRGPPPPKIFLALAVLLAALVLLVIVIARHLGKPLQQLDYAAREFGHGNLAARAKIDRSDELGEVGRTFDQMADRVTALMTAQRELMANVSHELHTPLARIQVAVDLMLDGIDTHAADLLPQISRDLGELQCLIDDILALSRFELARVRDDGVAVPVKAEVAAIEPVVREAIERFQARHPHRTIESAIASELPLASIDRVLLRRVLENLLDNAGKYSEPSTPIVVAAVADAVCIAISVRDRGIGIEPADAPHVFMPFFRSDRSRSRATGGFGLGLAFARRVVESLGGSIWVTSEPDVGTEVTFVIPRLPGQPAVARVRVHER
jgi:two-component system OmpR family sensor kinase